MLVDAGAGAMAPMTGRLVTNLQAEGVAPEPIDTVILTHAHPEHIGGNLDGVGRPAFPHGAAERAVASEWSLCNDDGGHELLN